MRMPRQALAALAAGGMVLGLVPGCGEPQGSPRTQAAEVQQSQQLLNELRAKDLLVEDRSLNAYVDGIVQRIEAQRPEAARPLQTFIIKDASANAFTSGAGYVFVHAGLLAAMENEAQLAMVLAHEIGHVDEGHVSAGMQRQQQIGLVGALAGLGGLALGLPQELVQLGVNTGGQYAYADFSREQETEADQVGLRYMRGAGYDAAAGAESFAVLRRMYGESGGLAQFFATHPRSSDRQAELVQMARQMGADQGRVAAEEYLRRTDSIRREVYSYMRSQGNRPEADQVSRNISRTR